MISAPQLLRMPVQFLGLNKRLGKECHAMHPTPETGAVNICVEEQHDTNA